MDDPELEAIRQRRMAEMSSGGGGGGGGDAASKQAEEEEKRAAAEDRRQQMLVTILQPEARERLSRISLVKPDKARGVENMLIQMAQRGQLGGAKVSEEQLIGMLEQINEQSGATKSKITYQRRSVLEDDF
mmetsp:Transcript_40724/g.104248  ORF Transcript_40724/g.104248 Transcript_40724/m.104248 type:complete len:131 (-) Transcript_40724:149-541(-)|eukprot:jgi/Tetstr1/437002/TSEL_002741.t1